MSTTPPAAVTDLLASANPIIEGPISLTWTAPHGNAGGTPIPNQNVGSYTIGYATFSVASLGNDATAWWLNPSGSRKPICRRPLTTRKRPALWKPPPLRVFCPASPITLPFAARAKASNVLSPIDTEASTPGLQAHALKHVACVGPALNVCRNRFKPDQYRVDVESCSGRQQLFDLWPTGQCPTANAYGSDHVLD